MKRASINEDKVEKAHRAHLEHLKKYEDDMLDMKVT